MRITTDYIPPAELTGYVRAALADLQVNQFTLSRYLPNSEIDDLDYRFAAGGEGLAEAATFRAYDAPSPIGTRPGVKRVSGQLPPVSRQIKLGEFDRLRQRRAGNDEVTRLLERDAIRMTRSVAARIELARGQALATGMVTIAENGVEAEVDFGREPTHSATAGTVWSTVATASVLSNLVTWRDLYVETNGSAPGATLTSTAVLRLVQRNKEIIDAVAGAAAERTRVNLTELNDLLESEGLPPFEVNDARVIVEGTTTRVLPANRIVMVPPAGDPNDPESSDLGATLWGTTAESLEPEYGIEDGAEPGIVAGVYKTPNPIGLWTNAAGISLPVLANPNLTLAATVTA